MQDKDKQSLKFWRYGISDLSTNIFTDPGNKEIKKLEMQRPCFINNSQKFSVQNSKLTVFSHTFDSVKVE